MDPANFAAVFTDSCPIPFSSKIRGQIVAKILAGGLGAHIKLASNFFPEIHGPPPWQAWSRPMNFRPFSPFP
jgi:hypothetical protein